MVDLKSRQIFQVFIWKNRPSPIARNCISRNNDLYPWAYFLTKKLAVRSTSFVKKFNTVFTWLFCLVRTLCDHVVDQWKLPLKYNLRWTSFLLKFFPVKQPLTWTNEVQIIILFDFFYKNVVQNQRFDFWVMLFFRLSKKQVRRGFFSFRQISTFAGIF